MPDDAPLDLCLNHMALAWEYCEERSFADRRAVRVAAEDRFRAEVDRLARERDERDERQAVELAAVEAAAMVAEVAVPGLVVYYVRFGDRIKIGFTSDLGRRLPWVPHDEVLGTEPGGRAVEAARHRQFAAHRIVGEWFAAAPELLAHIASLPAAVVLRHAKEREVAEREHAALIDEALQAWVVEMPVR